MILVLVAGTARSQTTAITDQGSLNNGTAPATGDHDFELALFDAVSGGAQLGTTQTLSNVAVSNGIFSVQVDFGTTSPAPAFRDPYGHPAAGLLFRPRRAVSSSPYS
jgi:hypothetical protein